MTKEFEAEVKRTKPGAPRRSPKRAKAPKGARKKEPEEAKRQEKGGLLKTAGGTPIIERQNG